MLWGCFLMRYRWFAHEDEKDEFDQPVSRALWHDEDREEHPKVIFSVGKGAGTFLAGMAVCCALWAGDLQLFLFSFSVLLYLLHPLARSLGGARGRFLSNFLKGFSLALGWGILIWVLL